VNTAAPASKLPRIRPEPASTTVIFDLSGAAAPLCFHVPRVAFRFSIEAHDRRPAGHSDPRAAAVTPGRT
jgi:hypothetical protein